MIGMKTVGILNGPNLNRLGKREPHIYGSQTLEDLHILLQQEAADLGVSIDCFQSNHEGALIDRLNHWADQSVVGVVFNPGAYTHTSIALHDAIAGLEIPVVEVHLSNLYKRESFRHRSVTAAASLGILSGFGFEGYCAALRLLLKIK